MSRNLKNVRAFYPWKISEFFLSENFHFLVVKFSVYLNRRVFVMYTSINMTGSIWAILWLGGLVVSALDFQAGYRGFESRSGRDNFQTISTPSLYSTCPGLSIKWTGRRLVTDSGTKCAWVIHESKAVQIHVHIAIAAASMCLGCLVALKIRTTTMSHIVWKSTFGHVRPANHHETYLYNFDPLKPHFYIVKLGFTGVCIIFLISAQKRRLWYSLEPPR